jgi:hypothetical protein
LGPICNYYIFSAAIILLITGLAKIVSASGWVRFLNSNDTILGITFRHLMLFVGFFELIISIICLYTTKRTLSLSLVAWISTAFAAYRLGLWLIGWQRPCACMGNLTNALHIPPQIVDNIMKVILIYLIIGSYLALAYQYSIRWKR